MANPDVPENEGGIGLAADVELEDRAQTPSGIAGLDADPHPPEHRRKGLDRPAILEGSFIDKASPVWSMPPSPLVKWLLCLSVVGIWGTIQLLIFHDAVMPLTYVLPLLLCVWTRDKRMLWGMAACFALFVLLKVWWIMPPDVLPTSLDWAVTASQFFNIGMGAVVTQAILSLRNYLEHNNAALADSNRSLSKANTELARRDEQISQQNRQLQAQGEELAQQNEELQCQGEELEQQTAELSSQAEELQTLNDELWRREDVLQTLLSASNPLAGEVEVLSRVCAAGMKLLGSDVTGAAVLEARGDYLFVHAQHNVSVGPGATTSWPLKQSLARLVMEENRPAALDDMSLRPDLIFPKAANGDKFCSMLAAPLRVEEKSLGAIEFFSTRCRPWTQDQFRLAQWLAAQSSTVLEMIRLRKALRSSEQRYRLFVEASAQVIWTTDGRGQVNMAVPSWQAFTGQTREQASGLGWMDAIAPEDRPRVSEAWAQALAAKGTYEVEYRLRRHDGQWRDVLARGVPMLEPGGEIREYVGTCLDITDRNRALSALRESEERFRTMADGLPLPVWVHGAQGEQQFVNRTFCEFFGVEGEEMTGEAWRTLLHPQDAAAYADEFLACVQARRPFRAETRARRADGAWRWVESYARPRFSPSGEFLGFVGASLDVTQRKEAETALAEARDSAEAANKAKDQFLAILSHELRTPLNPALMAATIIENHPQLPSDLREDASIIRRNVELEARLIDDMLDLTRIARGKVTLARRIVDGRDVLRHAIETCQPEAAEKEQKLEVGIPDKPVLVDADSARLQQVFWNLLKNAVKFTPERGTITVIASQTPQGGLRVEVRDSGRGIEKDALGRIFDAFEQGSPLVTRHYGGLGLGLAICKGLVAMHEGVITARSEGPGKGSTFAVELPPPARQADHPGPEGGAREAVAGINATCRILLVEDHESTAVMTARLLRSFGHEVTTAECIRCALEKFDSDAFELVISDLGLPDGSGQDLIAKLLARRPVKAIALSGYGMETDIQQSVEAGFLEHLVKPINARQLEDAINRVLRADHRRSPEAGA